jgi:hypothetical protein
LRYQISGSNAWLRCQMPGSNAWLRYQIPGLNAWLRYPIPQIPRDIKGIKVNISSLNISSITRNLGSKIL